MQAPVGRLERSRTTRADWPAGESLALYVPRPTGALSESARNDGRGRVVVPERATAIDLWAGTGRRVPAASWRPANPAREACPGSGELFSAPAAALLASTFDSCKTLRSQRVGPAHSLESRSLRGVPFGPPSNGSRRNGAIKRASYRVETLVFLGRSTRAAASTSRGHAKQGDRRLHAGVATLNLAPNGL